MGSDRYMEHNWLARLGSEERAMDDWERYCSALTPEVRAELADKIASAIEDGGPSPGADFLADLRGRWKVDTSDELLAPLVPNEDPETYLLEHWRAQWRNRR
jgi:hypothetical protein